MTSTLFLSFCECFLRLFQYIVAIPAGSVCHKSRQRGKLDGIGEDVGDWEVDSGVCVVCDLIEEEVGCEDFADIVRLAGVIENDR